MQKYVINSNFIYLNEKTTPFLNLLNCDPKIEKQVKTKGYNSINKWIKISEDKMCVSLTILPTDIDHGKLFVCPPISEKVALTFAHYIRNVLSMPIRLSYVVYNANNGLIDKKNTKYFCI